MFLNKIRRGCFMATKSKNLFDITYDVGFCEDPYEYEVNYLGSHGFEFNNVFFWFLFDYSIAKLISRVVEKKSMEIVLRHFEAEKNQNAQEPVEDYDPYTLLRKSRRAFGKNRLSELFEIKTKLFNADSPLLQHFCKCVATADSLDDVYNVLGSFSFDYDIIFPIAEKVDLWSKFYLSVPNGQSVRNRYRLVARLFHQLGNGNTLSIACGSAQPIIHAARELIVNEKSPIVSLVLTDFSEESLSIARKRTVDAGISEIVKLKQLPYQDIPTLFSKKNFNVIEACGILDYLPDRHARTLIEIALQGLTEGGHLILSNMAPTRGANLLCRMYNWEIIYRTPESFAELIQSAGAKNVKVFVEPWGIHPVAIATK